MHKASVAIQYETKINADGPEIFEEGPTLFSPNEACKHRYSEQVLVIVGGYWVQHHAQGPRKGYRVKAEDGKIYFCPAGDLVDLKGRQRHLQLVRPAAKARRGARKAAAHG